MECKVVTKDTYNGCGHLSIQICRDIPLIWSIMIMKFLENEEIIITYWGRESRIVWWCTESWWKDIALLTEIMKTAFVWDEWSITGCWYWYACCEMKIFMFQYLVYLWMTVNVWNFLEKAFIHNFKLSENFWSYMVLT